ncbi:transketolase [Pigmentibacter sp. JX0631]|uniref:transketolase n=1 Tax=Pigmentibacter sp. JX0631 TaxID=2976982 RepID=UPI002468695C|nr:transketolase [Pigmentibacter sp. JX0631]WGL60825.1 transketolase [Pigmentibacter sp. JX0631]
MLKPYSKEINPNNLRKNILNMAKVGNSVHIACAFSIVEILSVLYQNFINIDPSNLKNTNRDLFCLSKGHGVMALYSCLYEIGILPEEYLNKYFQDGSKLKGLSDANIPGIEVSGGSLGHGITVSVGLALAAKLKNKSNKIYCLIGDGEMNEGSVWEALLFSKHWNLDNLILIVDANQYQAMGLCSEILDCEPFYNKFEAFGFETWECDGHSVLELNRVFNQALISKHEKPKVVIARTVKGKGVSFMENNNAWHYSRLNNELFQKCLEELS